MMGSAFHGAFFLSWWLLGAALLGVAFGYLFCKADS